MPFSSPQRAGRLELAIYHATNSRSMMSTDQTERLDPFDKSAQPSDCCKQPFCEPYNKTPDVPSFPPEVASFQHLALAGPDSLDEAITLSQTVEGIVALAHRTNETGEGVDVVLAGDGAAVLVNLGDGDLDGGVVLGLDDAVGGAALARNVAIRRKKDKRLAWDSRYRIFGVVALFPRKLPPLDFVSRAGISWDSSVWGGGFLTDRRSRPCRSPLLRLAFGVD